MLSTLEEHFAATEQYKLSLRHLIYLRKQRAVEDTLHHETAKGLEQGLTAERAAERAQLAVCDTSYLSYSRSRIRMHATTEL